MAHILVVEDELPMLNGLKDNLEFEGYEVDTANDGRAGLEKIKENGYDLILLDVMLPSVSGFDICRQIRKEGILTPVILLTARGEEIDKIRGLELGADDYVVKPFGLGELLARIKAVLRRIESKSAIVSRIMIGRLAVDFNTFEAAVDDIPSKLSHKEFEVLKYLWIRKNQVVHRDELLKNIWSMPGDITTRTVDNFIVRLRHKVESDPANPRVILTVHGVGYKLVESTRH